MLVRPRGRAPVRSARRLLCRAAWGSASASSPALIRRPRVSDPDPQGSGRSLTTPESRLKTRGGRLWWQDSGR
ncbi:hypothetical protein NDU88_000947 [Pleurodeles waltl]|uniref:Uncharacterized protein n=1 Tax=Pleurodeles waltl TaxID=8319 RepID=A0AAV7ML77_PLEWA|nr:hypothetical protein NDU88_000947 [Pleurodeles waltl]